MGPYFQALALAWKVEQQERPGGTDQAFQALVERSLALSDRRVSVDPTDARAYLARGAAHGVRSRIAIFRGQNRLASREAVLMREALLQARQLQSDCSDADFGLGLYDYFVDVLPRFAKVLRFLSRMPGGNRERGLARIEEARRSSHFHRAEALAQLFAIDAVYEKRVDKGLEEIRELHRRYPGSPLWALRLADHERDAVGLYSESARVAREAIAASERHEVNYAPVVAAMARVSLADSLLQDLRFAEAREVLGQVGDAVEGASWVVPRVQLLLGRVLEFEGEREGAEIRYRRALRSPDPAVVEAATSSLRLPLSRAEREVAKVLFLARRERDAGRRAESFRAFREALRIWPESQEAQLRAVEADLEEGKVGTSRATLERLVSKEHPYPPWIRSWSHLLLGRVDDLGGDRAAAVREYKEVCQSPYGQEEARLSAEEGVKAAFSPRPGAQAPSDQQ